MRVPQVALTNTGSIAMLGWLLALKMRQSGILILLKLPANNQRTRLRYIVFPYNIDLLEECNNPKSKDLRDEPIQRAHDSARLCKWQRTKEVLTTRQGCSLLAMFCL